MASPVYVDSLDTGGQSTIISRALLHEIANSLKAQERPVPELKEPCTQLFGKECNSIKPELDITAVSDTLIPEWLRYLFPANMVAHC